MVSKNEKVSVMPYLMELSEVPVIKGSEVAKSPTVTEWDVEEGTLVNTIDPATGEIVFAPMTKVSRHTNLKMFDVKFGISGAYEHMSTVSEDHSLITYNSTSMELEKTRPEEALGACVPMTRFNWCNKVNDEQGCATHINFPSGNYSLSYDMGVFFGLMVGDGWVASTSANTKVAHIACCEESLQNYILELTKSASMPFTKQAALFSYAADEQRFSQRDKQRFTIYMDNEDKAFLEKLIGHGAENKHIPYKSFMGSIAHMIGVLMGLLATDGAVSHTPGSGNRKSAKKAIIYHTVSPTLRDGVQDLACRLGIKTSVTTYTGTSSGNTAYAIVFSLEDFARLYDKNPTRCVIPVSYKQEALMRIVNDVHENNKASCKTTVTSYDIVPFPRGLFCEFSWAKIVDISRDSVIAARTKGFIKRSVAKRIADALERRDWSIYKDPAYLKKADQTHRTPAQAKALVDKWIAMVRNDDIGWEVVTDVTPSTCTEGWDCTVPGPYTFSLSTGTIVQDTVNLHVPVSQAGIRDVR